MPYSCPTELHKSAVKTAHAHAVIDCSVKQLVRKLPEFLVLSLEDCCCDKQDTTAQDKEGQKYQMENKVHMDRHPIPLSQNKRLNCFIALQKISDSSFFLVFSVFVLSLYHLLIFF